jgi:AAA+ ATPase superfamily predicted ATPase
MLLKFVDRVKELDALEKRYQSNKSEFLIIYEVDRFRKKFSKKFNIYLGETKDFETLFKQILEKVDTSQKFIFLIDEFPYLIEKYKPILSLFQHMWDETLNDKNVFLILTGSSVSMMETEVLGYKSPLYGRRTGQLKIEPIKISYLKEFLPNYKTEDLLKTYGAVGGIPFYLKEFDSKKSFLQNIKNTFFNKSNILYEEAEILLREELREPNTYFNILKAILDGSTKLSEISTKSLVDITNINKYISVLETLKFVRKEYPITQPVKPRNFIYKVDDNYFRFWLNYVYPYKEEIEEQPESVLEFVKKNYNGYMGPLFEEIVRQYIWKLTYNNFNKIGKWWHKDQEIDIVGLNESKKHAVFFECKWKNLSYNASLKILGDLEEKADFVKWRNTQRKEQYGLIAKKIENKEDLRKNGFLVYDLDDW